MGNIYEIRTKTELAITGKCVRVFSKDEALTVLDFILDVLCGDNNEQYNRQRELIHAKMDSLYLQRNTVKFIVVNTLYGMRCISFLLEYAGDDKEYYYPAPFEVDYGTGTPCAFSYTHNVDADFCSELGDCFFQKREDGYYHRVS